MSADEAEFAISSCSSVAVNRTLAPASAKNGWQTPRVTEEITTMSSKPLTPPEPREVELLHPSYQPIHPLPLTHGPICIERWPFARSPVTLTLCAPRPRTLNPCRCDTARIARA